MLRKSNSLYNRSIALSWACRIGGESSFLAYILRVLFVLFPLCICWKHELDLFEWLHIPAGLWNSNIFISVEFGLFVNLYWNRRSNSLTHSTSIKGL